MVPVSSSLKAEEVRRVHSCNLLAARCSPMASGGFLDPKARGMNLGYDQAVALPAMQADGKSGQEDIFKETNKVGVGLMQGGQQAWS